MKTSTRKILVPSLLALSLVFTSCTTDDKDSGSAPTLSVEPSDQIVVAGTTATFTVIASGSGSLTYQWMRNDVNIDGATSATYSFPASISDDGAAYTVKISDSKGSITSHAAFLRILVTTKQITLGAKNNSSSGPFLDLDTWISYTVTEGPAHSNVIDLVFAFDTSSTPDSAGFFSPQYAKSINDSDFNFMKTWTTTGNITNIVVVSVANWNNVKTAADIKALYDAGTTPSPSGRVYLQTAKTIVAKSNGGLYVLLRIDAVTPSVVGAVSITGKALAL